MEKYYPIIIDGKESGRMCVSVEGMMTLYSAECREVPRVLRLSVYGRTGEGYLGVMIPDGSGNMVLKKRLSRCATAGFPKEIEYAGETGKMTAVQPEITPAAEPAPETAGGKDPEPSDEKASENSGTSEENCPCDENDLLWMATSEGFLVCFDGSKELVAVPLGDKRVPAGRLGEERVIEGKRYIVYSAKRQKDTE